MRGSLRDCTLALHLNSRSSDAAGVFAVAACTLAAAAIIALVYSAPSRAADPYDKFDSAIASWNKTCQHQVWPNLDSQCRRGAEVGTVRVIGGPQIPSEFYRDAEGLDPSDGATSCAAAGHSCLTATPATSANKA